MAARNPVALYSPYDWQDITAVASEVTLNDFSRVIRCEAAGVMVVRKLDGNTGTLRFAAGESQDVQIKGIVSITSGCLPITAYF